MMMVVVVVGRRATAYVDGWVEVGEGSKENS